MGLGHTGSPWFKSQLLKCRAVGHLASQFIPCISVSPFSFVWLVYLIWNLFQEGCFTSCAGMGHWHLSSPLLEDSLEIFVSSHHWPSASISTSSVTRDHQLSIRRQADLSLGGIMCRPNTVLGGLWHFVLFHGQDWELEEGPCFEHLLHSSDHYRCFKMKALTLWSRAVSLWWIQLALNVGHWHEKPQGLEFVYVCVRVGMCACVIFRSRVRPRTSTPEKPHLFLSAPSHSSLVVIGGKCPESLVKHEAAKNH